MSLPITSLSIGSLPKLPDQGQYFTPKVKSEKVYSRPNPQPLVRRLPSIQLQSEKVFEAKIQSVKMEKICSEPQLRQLQQSKTIIRQSLAPINSFEQEKSLNVKALPNRRVIHFNKHRSTYQIPLSPLKDFQNQIQKSIKEEDESKSDEKSIVSPQVSQQLSRVSSIDSQKDNKCFQIKLQILLGIDITENQHFNSVQQLSRVPSIDSQKDNEGSQIKAQFLFKIMIYHRISIQLQLSNLQANKSKNIVSELKNINIETTTIGESQEAGSKHGSLKNNSHFRQSDLRSSKQESDIRSKNESVFSGSQKSDDYYSIWDNKDLVYRGVDFDELEKKDNIQQFLQFFKMRYGQFPVKKAKPYSIINRNEEVISVAVNFARVNKKTFKKYFPSKQVIFEDEMDYSKPHEVEKDPNFIKFMDYIKDLGPKALDEPVEQEAPAVVLNTQPLQLRRRVLRNKTEIAQKPSLFKMENMK